MRIQKLTRGHPAVSFTTNIPGAFTPIFTARIPKKLEYVLRDNTPLIARFLTSAPGAAEVTVPDVSEIQFAYTGPGISRPIEINAPISIRAFNALTLAEQFNVDTIAQRLISIPDLAIGLKDGYNLIILLNSTVAINADATVIQFDVEEHKL